MELDAILARFPNSDSIHQDRQPTTETAWPSEAEMHLDPASPEESNREGPPNVQPASMPSASTGATLRVALVRNLTADEMSADSARAFVDGLHANLVRLGEALGLDLQANGAWDRAGDGVLVVEDAQGASVIIVPELGPSTDRGFGMLLRRMGANGIRTGVWLTADPRRDHMASVSWLNRSVDSRFFLVTVRAVEIEHGPAAFIFDTTVRPQRFDDPVPETANPPAGAAMDGGRRAGEASAQRVEEATLADADSQPESSGQARLLHIYGEPGS